ncbi:hypothetical protein J132_02907 [Termitomyces sp. J132]|nr:hypothetical protein J132_02907 [Termitomyces sp. J132]
MWIAEHVLKIDRPFCYNDDTYGVCDADDTKFYEPYGRFMPRNQCELLELWDLLGIPHKEKKQLSGNPLTIIGIEVDANEMTMTLPAHAKEALIAELRRFIAEPTGKAPSFSYKEFQQFAGGMNAALNVFPLLRPALTNIFARISETYRTFGESSADKQIQCDSTIRSDLNWALKHIRNSKGTRILQDARAWKPEEAGITAYTCSNLKSMVFWYPGLKPSVAYYFDTPSAPPDLEHFLEVLCVTSAFLDAASRQRSSAKIVIYTENIGIVKMFDSFHCSPIYNPLFKAVADSMIQHKHRLRVLHISAKKNIVPNLLLRESVSEARKHVSEIASFKPLDKLLGPLKDNLTGEKMHRGTV